MFIPSLPVNLRPLNPIFATVAVTLAVLTAITCSAQVDSRAMTAGATWESLSEPSREIWTKISEDTFDQRADFISGYSALIADTDLRIRDLEMKRSSVSQSDRQYWDTAMKDLHDARSDMSDKLTQARAATPDYWDDAKEKATDTWRRVQDDFDKVLHSTTS